MANESPLEMGGAGKGPKLVDYLLYEPEESGILWIKFNRPERMNALIGNSQENGTVAKVGEYMRAGDDDPNIRVIVLTGVGRGFCSGADMRRDTDPAVTGDNFTGNRGTEEGPDAARQHFFHGFTHLHRDISLIRKPTVAMVNGPAVGSGMDMALHCDIRVGCENTRFIGYQQLGQIIENGGSYYLPKMAGLGRALEFAYTGHLDAQRAYDWGLLNYLVPSEDLEQTTRDLCDRIMRTPPMVQWISKRIMRTAHGHQPGKHHGADLQRRRHPERLRRRRGSAEGVPGEASAGVPGEVGKGKANTMDIQSLQEPKEPLMSWFRLLGKDSRGSRPRCVLMVDGSREEVASRLTRLVNFPDVIISPSDRWMPYGKPLKSEDGEWNTEPANEAQFGNPRKPNNLVQPEIHRKLTDWWLAVQRGSMTTPNWDIATTCTIQGKPGLLLVEAKAHANELDLKGKQLDRNASVNSQENHKQIGRVIVEASESLTSATEMTWGLSRDHHYQLSNRFAWSWKLASLGIPVVLLYLGFLSAQEMADRGPLFRSETEWALALKEHSHGVVDGTCWGKWLDIAGTPFIALIKGNDQPFDPNCT